MLGSTDQTPLTAIAPGQTARSAESKNILRSFASII
jgi:hypothetical protein